MLARVLKPNVTAVAKRAIITNNLPLVDSRRYKSHGSHEVQHGDHHGEVDHHHGHHDPYKTLYERLWQHKATLDWLPKPEGNWQEINGKKQAHYNTILASGIVAVALAYIYLRMVIVPRSGALTQPPYHLIGHEDFPGSKYDDATGGKKQ
ncbi:unnamed protein product [Adineta steineri]|uniref:Deltamethrin resistance protein prag01 domain-containing protein n=1 Tax=Adineta steineri TaxID=433720 RepID=A0A813NN00_9BILA|nr:unnamed protein product [Adineta steineri]CAF0725784.1 unnamed protein product [Adineta steineri]CAF0731830.1 unnamed protein product [Adineta steineri]CAF0735906.1 unnamed protein product [Adineta steineri]CAF0737708.1 unnamed protein product [Adineta steineri]